MKLTGKVDKLGFEIKEHDVIVAIVGMSPVTGVVTLKDDKWVFRRLMMTPEGATVEEFDLSNIESKDIGIAGNLMTHLVEAPRRDRIRGRIRSHADNESARRRPRNEGFLNGEAIILVTSSPSLGEFASLPHQFQLN